MFSAELFGTRQFANARQLGALTGLVPVPYRSDQRVQDQGIGQPARRNPARGDSTGVGVGPLATRERADAVVRAPVRAGRQARAPDRDCRLARKLLIALWRYVEHGVIPEGAVFKATA